MKKYFEILGLKENASQEEIQEAYERLSNTLDPKKNDNLDFFIEEYALVQEAYKFLKKEVSPKTEKNLHIDDSIESIFETYKTFDRLKKIDFLKQVSDKINSGSLNHKIALNIICKYENCNNLELLFQKLKPTPKETPKPKKVSEPTKTSSEEKEKENSQKSIAVTDSDTSSTLIDKYNKAPKESKEGVLTLYKVLGSSGNKECLLALHELLGEPLDLDENFLVMVVQGIASNPQASDKPIIKEGKGEFGLSKTNPIPVYGIPSNEIYLNQLKTDSGGKITWKRKGSIKVKGIEKEIDEYLIYDEKSKKIATFFISPYHWKTSNKIPKGFIHIDKKPIKDNSIPEKSKTKNIAKPKLSEKQNPSKNSSNNKRKNTNLVLLISFICFVGLIVLYLTNLNSKKDNSIPEKKVTIRSKPRITPLKLSDIKIQFKTKTDKASYKLNQTINLEFIVTKDASDFKPPSFEGFEIISGPKQNTRNTWMDGKFSYEKIYKYELKAKKSGALLIAPAKINYKGFTFNTDSVFIRILSKKSNRKINKQKNSTPQKKIKTQKNPKIFNIVKDAKYYEKLGMNLFNDGNYINALVYFDKASQLNPKEGLYYYKIGLIRKKLKSKNDACIQFRKALENGYNEAQNMINSYCDFIVKGTVFDHKNRKMIAAKVTNKSTGESVYTNFDGEYSIKAKEGDIILFEVGYKKKKYPAVETPFETSFGYIINVKFLKKRDLWSREIRKIKDSKNNALSKLITSKY